MSTPAQLSADERCDSPATRKLLVAYGLNRATAEEREAFQLHALSCPECSDDLAAMWRVATLLDDWVRRPQDAPTELASVLREHRLRRRIRAALALLAAIAIGYFLKAQF